LGSADPKELGARLELLREQEGISAKGVADALRVSPQTIRNFEKGEHETSLSVALGYLAYLELPGEVLTMTPEEFAEFYTQRGQRRVERRLLAAGERLRDGSQKRSPETDAVKKNLPTAA